MTNNLGGWGKKQVKRGHNIVADGWAGAANSHPHQMPHPTPLPTQTHTKKAPAMLVFSLFDSCSLTDGRTEPLIELRVRN